jgi:hypothetical protein
LGRGFNKHDGTKVGTLKPYAEKENVLLGDEHIREIKKDGLLIV